LPSVDEHFGAASVTTRHGSGILGDGPRGCIGDFPAAAERAHYSVPSAGARAMTRRSPGFDLGDDTLHQVWLAKRVGRTFAPANGLELNG